MTLLGVALLLFGILLTILGASVVFPGTFQFIRDFFEKPLTLNALTALLVIANFFLAWATYKSLNHAQQANEYARQANERAERLFTAENRPLIDVAPIGVSQVQVPGGTQALTTFSIVNYSGFTAYKIGIDLKYGDDNAWILEWRKARNQHEKEEGAKGVVKDKMYASAPGSQIEKLAPGETTELPGGIIGALNLESVVCAAGYKGFPVWFRVTWQNEKGHVFDELHKYKLICTKDTQEGYPTEGRAFTFVPEGVMAQKK